MKRILVLGGNGFVGREILRVLAKNDTYQLSSLSRTEPKQREPSTEYYFADLHNAGEISPVFQKTDVIINASGMVSFLQKDSEALRRANADMLKSIADVIHSLPNIQRFVHISSCASFGAQHGTFSEHTEPEWKGREHHFPYSYSKHLGDKVVQEFSIPKNILYPPLILGPQDTKVLPSIFSYTEKSPLLLAPQGANGIIDVRDFARAIAMLLESNIHEENFIVTGKTVSFADLLHSAQQAKGTQKPLLSIPRFVGKPLAPVLQRLESWGLPIRSENIYFGFCHRDPQGEKIKKHLRFIPEIPLEKTMGDFIKHEGMKE
jgi:dihydroflavonol-4-reductase